MTLPTKKPVGRGGAGRGQGRKPSLIQGKATPVYIDLPTRKVLAKVHPIRSKAIRLFTGTEPDTDLDQKTRDALKQIRAILATLTTS